MDKRNALAASLLGCVVILALTLLWQRATVLPAAQALVRAAAADLWTTSNPERALGPSGPEGQALRTPEQLRARLFQQGSFAGSEPAGDWCVTARQLRPCAALRDRFEYYVQGLGEVSLAELRSLVREDALQVHGPQLALELMALWDRYWQLREQVWRHQFVQSDRSTWRPVFEEQHAVRRRVMGADWAEAFFSDEERYFQAYYLQAAEGPVLASHAQALPQPVVEPALRLSSNRPAAEVHSERVARYGPEAAQRLAQADAQWADWERRLALVQLEWARLQGAEHLSDLQRREELRRYIDLSFPPDERLRVHALMRL